ncbi:MAG TPA: acyltransferase [Gammaproteobacteria bacterium]|nr:acyltransferase [Gammaproteobacteria bacterium]
MTLPAEAPLASNPARNQGIDLLRGVSIVLVILNHVGLRIPLSHTALASLLPRRLLVGLNYNGYEAVFVFFVISGFLIANNSLRRWGVLRQIDLRGFYARRFARIVPCLVLLIAVLGILDGFGFEDYTIKHASQSLWRVMLAAVGLHLNWYEGQTGYLPGNWDVLWSLSIEEMFYIGFPLACLMTQRNRVLIPLLVVLAVSLPVTRGALHANEIWQEKAYLPGMAAIATGILGALLVARAPLPRRYFTVMLCAAATLGLVAVGFFGGTLWSAWRDGYMLLLTFSSLCLITGFHWREQAGWRRAVPGLGWLRACGRLSYEIYLTHMFVVYAAVRLFRNLGGDLRTGYLWYVPILLLCGLLGWLVARFISMPLDRGLRTVLLKPGT